ncbi:MAG: hypothetical protein K6A92_07760 [Lachnospiraceae bacterium]|nr:hypothetical protein [Lachnospiraceae bacterium]
MSIIKSLLLIAALGHLLCGCCDCLLTYVPGGKKFGVKQLSDSNLMADTFEKMPLRNPLLSMLLGCLALFMCSFGYYGIYLWMKGFSNVYAVILLISTDLFLIIGTAHHILCGVSEWFYVRMGRTEEAFHAVIQLFKDTSATMIGCYLGWAVFGIALFVAVITGATDLPRWACVFNCLPLFIVTFPFHIVGKGNWCGAVMFVGLMFMI